jgi:hypothetical protein
MTLFGRKGLDATGNVPGVFRQDTDPLCEGYQIFIQETSMADRGHGLVGHNGQGPEEKDKAGLLLIVTDQHIDGALRDMGGILFRQPRLFNEEGVGPGAYDTHIQGMDKDNNYSQ